METALKINVLVVDDNHINRLLLKKVISKWGAMADFAENGAQAIEKIESNRNYDVVLMDVYMPETRTLLSAITNYSSYSLNVKYRKRPD